MTWLSALRVTRICIKDLYGYMAKYYSRKLISTKKHLCALACYKTSAIWSQQTAIKLEQSLKTSSCLRETQVFKYTKHTVSTLHRLMNSVRSTTYITADIKLECQSKTAGNHILSFTAVWVTQFFNMVSVFAIKLRLLVLVLSPGLISSISVDEHQLRVWKIFKYC